MKFDINPYVGIGSIAFGMRRDAVRTLLGPPVESFMKTPDSKLPTDDFTTRNLHIYYEDDFACCGLEFFRPSTVAFRGLPIVGRPFNEVMAWLSRLDPSARLEDSVVTSKAFGFSLYAPDAEDDGDSLVESVYVFSRKS